MIRNRDLKDLENELALYKNLTRLQVRLMTAYQLQELPSEALLNGLAKTNKALEKYRALDILRANDT